MGDRSKTKMKVDGGSIHFQPPLAILIESSTRDRQSELDSLLTKDSQGKIKSQLLLHNLGRLAVDVWVVGEQQDDGTSHPAVHSLPKITWKHPSSVVCQFDCFLDLIVVIMIQRVVY